MPSPLKIEYLKTTALIPYAANSRTHSESQIAQIAGSIREFGFTNPVLIDEANGIIAGHGRVMAADKLAMDKVPCIRLSYLTETQRRAYVIADNRLAENGSEWDKEKLKREVESIKWDELSDFDLQMLELDDLLKTADEEDQSDELDKAIQLEPSREYIVVMCKNADEWEALKSALSLPMVRRGGYKKGSAFDAVSTQRVVKAESIIERLK